jgi:hypothetical protein
VPREWFGWCYFVAGIFIGMFLDAEVIGAMMCAYGVPGYITYGPPALGSVDTPWRAIRPRLRRPRRRASYVK